jgi:hypothetical protein
MLCGAVVASRGGWQMKEAARGEEGDDGALGEGEMSKMSGLPLEASFLEFKACWQFFLKKEKGSCSCKGDWDPLLTS